MHSLSVALLAGATIASAFSSAQAADPADLPPIMGPQPIGAVPVIQQVAPVPVIQDFGGGWYLRGDISIGVQRFKEFDHVQTNSAFVWPASWRIEQQEVSDTTTFGGGIGFQWNSWLRFDVTAESRGKSRFSAIGSYTEFCTVGRCFDTYQGNHSAISLMANGYVDLGTWLNLTPFVGAGAGYTRHSISGLSDAGFLSNGLTGFGYASNNDFSDWTFTWALHAGIAYCLSNNFKLELAYRYMNFGNVNTSIIDCASGGCSTGSGARAFYTLREMDSHDLRFGIRWMLAPEAVVAPAPAYPLPPPLIRKG